MTVPVLGFLQRFDIDDVRAGLFLSALCLYAFAGSPTPDSPGLVEVCIAVLLMGAVGLSSAYQAFRLDLTAPLWRVSGQVFLLYGLSVVVLMAAIAGHDKEQVLRDIFPFLFMMLPLFLSDLLARNERLFKLLILKVLLIGVVFSIRSLADIGQNVLMFVSSSAGEASGELTYFANMPTVLFAALFIFGISLRQFTEHFTFKSLVLFLLGCGVAALILLPVAMTAQRASLGYVVVYVVILIGLALYRAPYRGLCVIAIVGALLFPFYNLGGGLVQTLMEKTSLVGVNARFAELEAVWSEIFGSIPTLLFGSGWGGSFESPAVADIRVNFTHSLLSSALLKMGVVGVILVILYLLGIARILWSFLRDSPVLALALAGPIVIDVFLYASFKSLDFGLILLLVSAFGLLRAKIAKPIAV